VIPAATDQTALRRTIAKEGVLRFTRSRIGPPEIVSTPLLLFSRPPHDGELR